jgi:hypothetical protein
LNINKHIETNSYEKYLEIAIKIYNDISSQLDVLLESTLKKSDLTLELGKIAHDLTRIHHENYFLNEFQKTTEDAIAASQFISIPIQISFDAPAKYWQAKNKANKKWQEVYCKND